MPSVAREAVGDDRRPQRERRLEGDPLGLRQAVAPVEDGPDDVGEAGEGELRLGFDGPGPEDAHAARRRAEVLQERGLADARLAADDDGDAPSRAETVQHRAQPRALLVPPDDGHGPMIAAPPGRVDPFGSRIGESS
jgi:hypothetical protein